MPQHRGSSHTADARRKLELWRDDYNHYGAHSALADRTPAEFAAVCNVGNGDDTTAVETLRIYQVPTARRRLAIIESMPPVSALLLEIIT